MKKEATRQQNSLLFEGITSINAVLKSGRKIKTVYFDNAKIKSKRREYDFIKKKSRELSFELKEVNRSVIDELAIGSSHGGIIAECLDREIPRLTNESDIKSDGFYVMIEGIEDPYNFGYALRTIYASGADGIILSERNWMSAAGVVCRSSAGASEIIQAYISNPMDATKIFKEKGYKVVCAGIRNSKSLYDADLSKPILLIVGGEKRGISSSLLSEADLIVRIDYGRTFSGSLSSASASSILAYEVFRQNRKNSSD